MPPPLLHSTPKTIIHMRRLAVKTFMRNISHTLRYLSEEVSSQAWEAINDLIMPHAESLPDDANERDARTDLLISMRFRQCSSVVQSGIEEHDPFAAPSAFKKAAASAHAELTEAVCGTGSSDVDVSAAIKAWRLAVQQRDEQDVIAVLRSELTGKSMILAKHGVEAFIEASPCPLI